MVAEVKPARRRAGSTPPRSSRRGRAVVVGVGIAALVGIVAAPLAATAGADTVGLQAVLNLATGGVVVDAASAAGSGPLPSVADEDDGVSLRVTPTISTSVSPSGPVTISVEIENATGGGLAAGQLRLARSDDSIDDEGELADWLAVGGTSEDGAGLGDGATVVAEGEARAVAAGGTALVSFTVPPEQLAELAGSPIIGLGAELVVGDTVVATGTDAYPNADVPTTGSVAVALVAPLTVPVADDTIGLIPAAQLENWTGPTGVLTRQLDALAGRRVAIGLDPRILASIRVLGTSAPAAATAWLQRLAALPNEIFPLAYADADVTVQSQIGLPALLEPTTFADVMDPANFTATAGGNGAGAGDADVDGDPETAEPTATPTEPETPDAVPTTEELLDWPYTRTDLAWPADDTVAPGDLAYLEASGLTTTVLAPSNVAPVEGPSSASALIDGSTALAADAGLTEPLRAAADAQTEAEWRAATGRLLAELALDAGAARTTMLASFDRGAPALADRMSAVIDEIEGSRWSTLAGLADAIGAPPEPRSLVDEAEAVDRRSTVARMTSVEADVVAFASVLAEPELLTAPARRDLLSVLSVAWLEEGDAWNAAAGEWLRRQRDTVGAVSVVPSSPINVLSTETGVPTTIDNTLPYPVTVFVEVEPSNGRLIVEDRVEVTVGPESRSTVSVPVAARIGNGEVSLTVSLTSPTGVPIGTPVTIPANVQADWEGLGAAILASIAVLVFGIGIWRNIRRRRRARAEAAAEVSGGGAEAEASGSPDAPAGAASGDATPAEAVREPASDPADSDADADTEDTARG
ncbi:MAG: hypothetical protein K0S05_1654 [Agromyces sp.]|nr:hypothetical protein [Agromyces sp.]